jgi:hypothetical protein
MTIDRRALFSPGLLIQVATILVTAGISWGLMSSKLDVLAGQNARTESEVSGLRVEIEKLRSNQEQVIRAQEQMRYFEIRLAALEGFRAAQIEYNGSFMTKLAVLQKEVGP